jgi:LacI family transcriptional regulator
VPEDVSVVGYDDIPLASYVQPQLTTVRQPAFEKGILAARSLIDSLETGDSPKSTILSVELIARQSTARCIESLPEMNS